LCPAQAAATRPGSLDVAIGDDAVPNNFRAFFNAHPCIRLVGFNGTTAAKFYERHVIPTLTSVQQSISRKILPSGSGVNASMTFAEKATRWSALWGDATI